MTRSPLEQRIIDAMDALHFGDSLDPKLSEPLFAYLEVLEREQHEAAPLMKLQLMIQLPPPALEVPEELGARGAWLPGAPMDLIEALEKRGITCLEHLQWFNKRELTSIAGVGRGGAKAIEGALKGTGVSLKPSKGELEKRFKAGLRESGWFDILKGLRADMTKWLFGFLHRVTIREDNDIDGFLEHPMCRFLRSLTLTPVYSTSSAERLFQHDLALLELNLGRYARLEGDLATWFKAHPDLQRASFLGQHLFLSTPVVMPRMRQLTIRNEHRFPPSSLKRLLDSELPKLKELTLTGLADEDADILIAHRDALKRVKLRLEENFFTEASVSRLKQAFRSSSTGAQRPGAPPRSDRVPEEKKEGLPELSGLDLEALSALLGGTPSPLEVIAASERCLELKAADTLADIASSLPPEDQRVGTLVLAALEAGRPFEVAGVETAENPWRSVQENLELISPLRLELSRWSPAMEQLFATDCLEHAHHHHDTSLPFELDELIGRGSRGWCEPGLISRWDPDRALQCSRRRAFGQLEEAEVEELRKTLENLENCAEMAIAEMWESERGGDLSDGERKDVSQRLDLVGLVRVGLEALLGGQTPMSACLYAADVVRRSGGDVEAERRWQWLRLLAYKLEHPSMIDARLAFIKDADAVGFTREVCRLLAAAQADEDQAMIERARTWMTDDRFGWSPP